MSDKPFHDPQINYYAKNVELMVRFYSEHFGFVETFRTPKQGTPIHAELRLGGLTLGFASVEAGNNMHGLELDSDATVPRCEVVLWTDNVDEVYQTLIEKGVKGQSEPHTFLDTVRAAWVLDPEGNPVEIASRVAVHN